MRTQIWVIISQVGGNVRKSLKMCRYGRNEVWIFLKSIFNLTCLSTHLHDQIDKGFLVLHVQDIFKELVHLDGRILLMLLIFLSLSMITSTRPLLGGLADLRALLCNLGPLGLLPE